jgi:stage IV sporulation protein FB
MLRLGPLRLHWSLLLGAALFCTLQPRPLLLLGYAAILLVHVFGHALALSGTHLGVSGVMLHGLGGELLGEGETTPLRRSVIALSGVLAQLALLLGALLAARLLPADLADAFVRRNGILLLLNLIPMRPLDGAQAWRLIPRLRAAMRRARLHGPIVVREVPISRDVRKDVKDLLEKIKDSTKVR